jgi:hypothetical protein
MRATVMQVDHPTKRIKYGKHIGKYGKNLKSSVNGGLRRKSSIDRAFPIAALD